jgi:L-histidine N-alpha-methyltransferase
VRAVHSIVDHSPANAIAKGLSEEPKRLPSWLFYDETGDKLFQKIMCSPEYYLTRCEFEILSRHKEELLHYFSSPGKSFQLIELGAGDGRKTEILLRHFLQQHAAFTYVPIDISATILSELTSRLKHSLPLLEIHAVNNDYFESLAHLSGYEKKVLLFLGANIGNFIPAEAKVFLEEIARTLHEKDLALIGIDLKKSPRIIAKAYDDAQGITREFNLNLLKRLNNEFGGQFNLHDFEHYPYYDPKTGAAKSYLVSLKDQNVYIEALGETFRFSQWETIETEISQKYDMFTMEKLLSDAGLEIIDLFFDSHQYFCDVLVKRVKY